MKRFSFLRGSLILWPLLLVAVISGATANSADFSLEQVISQMKLKEQSIKSIKFSFEQEVTFLNSSLTSRTEGEALFEKPNKLNVRIKIPQEQVTFADGRKTWIYTPSHHQVWVGNAKKDFASLLPKGMVPINNLGEDLEKNYNLSFIENKLNSSAGNSQRSVRLSATPKQPSDYHLEFVVSTESWLPEKTIFESSSAKVVTQLKGVNINPDIPEKYFQFVPPPGTDVIPF